jgi:hypothetical protein
MRRDSRSLLEMATRSDPASETDMATDLLLQNLSPHPFDDIDPAKLDKMLARIAAENARFVDEVETFAAYVLITSAAAAEPAKFVAVQRKMLVHMIKVFGPEHMVPLSELADAIGERNRKLVREAGRALAAKGVLIVTSEPYDGAEGERVIGYNYTDAVAAAFDARLVAMETSFLAEAADAVKQ